MAFFLFVFFGNPINSSLLLACWTEKTLQNAVDTDRLIIADGVDLCAKHYSSESEEEDGFKTEED